MQETVTQISNVLDFSCLFPQLIENIYHRRNALLQELTGRFMKRNEPRLGEEQADL
jgi:hypothetical protein